MENLEIAEEISKEPSRAKKSNIKKIIGALLCVVAVVCVVLGINQVTSVKYKNCIRNRIDCIEACEELIETAEGIEWEAVSSYLSNDLVDVYQNDLIPKYDKLILEMRIKAIALILCGAASGVGGVILIISKKKRKATTDSEPQLYNTDNGSAC